MARRNSIEKEFEDIKASMFRLRILFADLEKGLQRISEGLQDEEANLFGRSSPRPTTCENMGPFPRTPDGYINNCLIISDGREVDPKYGPCQICNGICPDRERLAGMMTQD